MLNVADHTDYFTLDKIGVAFEPRPNRITPRKIGAREGLIDDQNMGRLRSVVFVEPAALFQRDMQRLKERRCDHAIVRNCFVLGCERRLSFDTEPLLQGPPPKGQMRNRAD